MNDQASSRDDERDEEEEVSFDDLLEGGFMSGPSRSEINAENRRTHGLSQTREYHMCKRSRASAREEGIPLYDEWNHDLGSFTFYVILFLGRAIGRVRLRPRVYERGFVPGNLEWENRLEPPSFFGSRAGWNDGCPCICDYRLRLDCPCPVGAEERCFG